MTYPKPEDTAYKAHEIMNRPLPPSAKPPVWMYQFGVIVRQPNGTGDWDEAKRIIEQAILRTEAFDQVYVDIIEREESPSEQLRRGNHDGVQLDAEPEAPVVPVQDAAPGHTQDTDGQ